MTPVQEQAAILRKFGYALVVLHGSTKKPKYRGWRGKSAEPGDFGPDDAIGIQCGAPSGNLVCVDFDDPRAVAVFRQHGVLTEMREGRPGNPDSHHWFILDDITAEYTSPLKDGGPKIISFKGPDTKEILAVKGTGGFAVVPPSNTPSGEIREWANGECGAPSRVQASILYSVAERVATALGYIARDRGKRKPKPTTTTPVGSANPAAPIPAVPDTADADTIRRATAYIGTKYSEEGKHGDDQCVTVHLIWRSCAVSRPV